MINEVPLQRGGRKKNGILARGSCSGFVDEKTFLTQLMYLSSFYLCFPLHNRKDLAWRQSRPNCVLTVSNVFPERAHTLQISGLSGDK